MTSYQKILNIMRSQGAKDNEKGVRLAEVGDNLSVTSGGLTLEKDDLLFASHLISGYLDQNGQPVEPLKKGEAVLIKRLNDDKYAVIERVIDIA